MPQFRYVARSAEGKLVDGTLDCHDRAAAIRQVEQQRYVPIKIEPLAAPAPAPRLKAPVKSAPAENGFAPAAAGEVTVMTSNQLFLFTEQLAHLLAAGMTLDESLGIMVRRMKHPRLHGVSRGLHQGLVDGRSLSQTLRDYPRIFSALYVNMVAAGEASGALPEILKRLVVHLSDLKALRDRVQQALLYPAMIMLAGVGLIIMFITVMVPKLTGFLKETGGDLPFSTRVLLQSNAFLSSYWWAILLAGGLAWAGFRAWVRAPAGRKSWDTLVWRLPVYSLVMRYRYFAQFARTLGTLSENGVTLLRALELLEPIADNEFVREKMVGVRRAVVDGATLSKALTEQHLFPELFLDMLAVGEQTGRFGSTMHNIAQVYERELDKQVLVISTLIPPVIMVCIAGLVGFLVFGIISALFSATQGLRGGGH